MAEPLLGLARLNKPDRHPDNEPRLQSASFKKPYRLVQGGRRVANCHDSAAQVLCRLLHGNRGARHAGLRAFFGDVGVADATDNRTPPFFNSLFTDARGEHFRININRLAAAERKHT